MKGVNGLFYGINNGVLRGIRKGVHSLNEKYGLIDGLDVLAEDICRELMRRRRKGEIDDFDSNCQAWVVESMERYFNTRYDGDAVFYDIPAGRLGLDCDLTVCWFCDGNDMKCEAFYDFSKEQGQSFIGLNVCDASPLVHELRHMVDCWKFSAYMNFINDYNEIKWRDDYKSLFSLLYLTSDVEMNAFLQEFHYDFRRAFRNYLDKTMPGYQLNDIESLRDVLRDFSDLRNPKGSFATFAGICYEGDTEDYNTMTLLKFMSYDRLFRDPLSFYLFLTEHSMFNQDVFMDALSVFFGRLGWDFDAYRDKVMAGDGRKELMPAYKNSGYYEKLPRALYMKYGHYYRQIQKIISDTYAEIYNEVRSRNRIDYGKERDGLAAWRKREESLRYKVVRFLKGLFRKEYEIEVVVPGDDD